MAVRAACITVNSPAQGTDAHMGARDCRDRGAGTLRGLDIAGISSHRTKEPVRPDFRRLESESENTISLRAEFALVCMLSFVADFSCLRVLHRFLRFTNRV